MPTSRARTTVGGVHGVLGALPQQPGWGCCHSSRVGGAATAAGGNTASNLPWVGRANRRPADLLPASSRGHPHLQLSTPLTCSALPAHPPQPAGVLKASAALLGDVASTLSGTGPLFQQKPYVQPFLQQLAQDSTTADTANWASQMIQKALRG